MKVYSLYYKDTFVVAFPNRDYAVNYGKEIYGDDGGWDCSIVEEYLSKTPLDYSYTSQSNDPKPYFDTYGGVKAEPYRNVRAYWND